MNPRDLLRLVWANLNRMRGRAVMTALGVLIGTGAIVVLISLANGLQTSTTGSFSNFGAANRITVMPGAFIRAFGAGGGGGESPFRDDARLTTDRLEELSRMEGVDAVTPYEQLAVPTELDFNRLRGTASIVGIDPRAVRGMGIELEQGTERLGRWTVIVGARVAENFVDPRGGASDDDEPPDLFGQTLTLELTRTGEDGQTESRTVRLRVGGVLAEMGGQDDNTIFMALDDVEDLNYWYSGDRVDRRTEGYNQAVVVINDPEVLLLTEQQLLDEGFYAFSMRSILQQINLIFVIIQAMFGGVGAIALVVAAIGIANTMIMSILERTREIGLMKAVGATNRDVMTIFIAEAGAIGLLGGLGGVVFGIIAAKIIDLIAGAYIAAQTAATGGSDPVSLAVIPLWLPIFAVLFSLVVGLASGIYPALRAVQLNPVTALKYE